MIQSRAKVWLVILFVLVACCSNGCQPKEPSASDARQWAKLNARLMQLDEDPEHFAWLDMEFVVLTAEISPTHLPTNNPELAGDLKELKILIAEIETKVAQFNKPRLTKMPTGKKEETEVAPLATKEELARIKQLRQRINEIVSNH